MSGMLITENLTIKYCVRLVERAWHYHVRREHKNEKTEPHSYKRRNEKKSERRGFCANRENYVFFYNLFYNFCYLVLVTPPAWRSRK